VYKEFNVMSRWDKLEKWDKLDKLDKMERQKESVSSLQQMGSLMELGTPMVGKERQGVGRMRSGKQRRRKEWEKARVAEKVGSCVMNERHEMWESANASRAKGTSEWLGSSKAGRHEKEVRDGERWDEVVEVVEVVETRGVRKRAVTCVGECSREDAQMVARSDEGE
jgi:hypothetical protein